MKIQIKNRFNNSGIFETDAASLGAAIIAALAAKANLTWANLTGANLTRVNFTGANLTGAGLSRANLTGANLTGANLTGANLTGANLTGANLTGANLSRANLTGANLTGAGLSGAKIKGKDLAKLVAVRTIVPQEGEFVAWKKLKGGEICKLKIPADAERVGGLLGRKCRASCAVVISGTGETNGHGPFTVYRPGTTVVPDKFDPNPLVECSHGIHFFITREEAEAY